MLGLIVYSSLISDCAMRIHSVVILNIDLCDCCFSSFVIIWETYYVFFHVWPKMTIKVFHSSEIRRITDIHSVRYGSNRRLRMIFACFEIWWNNFVSIGGSNKFCNRQTHPFCKEPSSYITKVPRRHTENYFLAIFRYLTEGFKIVKGLWD